MKKSNPYTCYACERYTADSDLLAVINAKTKQRIALHRRCAVKLIETMKPPARAGVRRAIARQKRTPR